MSSQGTLKTVRLLFLVIYIILIIAPLAVIRLPGFDDFAGIIFQIGMSLGLVSFCLLVLQVVLTSRWKTLESIYGLDKLTNFHKTMGILIGLLLTAHVIIMIGFGIKYSAMAAKLGEFGVDIGKWAYGIALITITLALTFGSFRMDYNVWRLSHKTAPVIVVLAFFHSYLVGPDLRIMGMKVYWFALLFIFIIAFLYRNFFIPVFARKSYSIKSVAAETDNTFTLTYLPDRGKRFSYKPGQFILLRLKRPGRKSETHPFTLSSSPSEGQFLQNTIKQSGNFTNTINQTTTSDKVIIEGPYGRFSFLNAKSKALLFIAGGVGITPIMSMIKYMRDTNDSKDVILLYGNRTVNDIIFRKELEKLPVNFKVIHILSNADTEWNGLKGYITKDIIAKYAKDILFDADVFLCGPPKMMQKIVSYLKELRIPASRVHYERFSI